MSKEQLKVLKEAIKAEMSPLLIGLRNEIKESNKLLKALFEKNEVQKTEVINQPDPVTSVKVDNPVDKVEVLNPVEEVKVKDIKENFDTLSDTNKKGVKKIVDVLTKGIDKLKKSTFKVEVDNQIELPDVLKVKVQNPPKNKAIQRVKIENSTPGDAIPVVLTDKEKRGFYTALSQLVGFGKTVAQANGNNVVSSAVNGQATVGLTSTIVVPANANRTDLEIVNDSNDEVYLARGATAILNSGIRLNRKGGSYSIASGNLYKGAIHAISATAGNNITISEGS